jgi:hypothetical protein
MKEVEGQGDLSRIETSVILGKSALSLHVEHQVSSIHKLNHKEQSEIKFNVFRSLLQLHTHFIGLLFNVLIKETEIKMDDLR